MQQKVKNVFKVERGFHGNVTIGISLAQSRWPSSACIIWRGLVPVYHAGGQCASLALCGWKRWLQLPTEVHKHGANRLFTLSANLDICKNGLQSQGSGACCAHKNAVKCRISM